MANTFHDTGLAGPLVSCLMVTLPAPGRFAYACASIDAFCRQTYAHTELLVVIDGGTANGGTALGRQRLKEHIASLNRPNIRIFEPDGELSLGALRNMSVENAAGEILCQWDDDDLHHPERLQHQVEALLRGGYDALFLQEVMQYFPRLAENLLDKLVCNARRRPSGHAYGARHGVDPLSDRRARCQLG